MIFLSPFLQACYRDVYINSFFPYTARLWNSLPVECFSYDLDYVFPFLESSNLLTPKESGFRLNYFCVFQLLSVVHSIYSNFVRTIFLVISKAFDKVLYEGLLYKLETLGIFSDIYNYICIYIYIYIYIYVYIL